MKRMYRRTIKKYLVVVIMLITYSVAVNAQYHSEGGKGDQQGPPPIPNEKQIEKMVSELSEELSLTENQEEKILDLYIIHFEMVEKKMESGRPSRNEMEALKTEFDKDVMMLLSDEQDKLFDAFQKEKRLQHEQKRQER